MATEFSTYKLGEICDFQNGFAFKSSDYVAASDDTFEVFRMGYIARGGGYKEDDSPVFVPRRYSKALDRFLLNEGDITIAMTDMKNAMAILAHTARVPEGNRFVLNQRVGRITVRRTDIADQRYIFYYSNLPQHIAYLRSRANSGVQVNLSTESIKEAEILLPPIAEQRAIVEVLGPLDDKIELNRRMSETLESMARAIFKSWFVDFDPVRAKSEGRQPFGMNAETAVLFPSSFDDSPLGKIPRGWTTPKLGEIVELAYGKALKEENRRQGKVPVYGSNGAIGWHDEAFVKGPGIVVGRKGNPGIVTWAPTDFVPIDTTFYVLLKSPLTSFHYAFHSLSLLDLASLGADSAVPGLNRNIAYMSRVLLPSSEMIKTFDWLCDPLSLRVHLNDEESRTLAAIRDAFLPKLISGEIRIKDAEKMVGEKV